MGVAEQLHPGLERVENGLLIAATALTAGKLALETASHIYHGRRAARYTPEQLEAATEPSGIVPYIEFALQEAERFGFEVVLAGGIAKKALIDPETFFDPESRTIRVSDRPKSMARRNATVVRPGELTERDIDMFVKYVWLGEGDERRRVIADQANPEIQALIKAKREELQANLDTFAESRGLAIGPAISLFAYDAPYGHDFNLFDYATKTEYIESDGQRYEVLYDNMGNSVKMPIDEQWTMLIGDLEVPVNSPQTQLGRTLNRTTVIRKRDLEDVVKAIRNLKIKNLWSGDMTDIWEYHQGFRQAMNESLALANIAKRANIRTKAHMLGLRALAPLTGWVEGTDILTAAIRDRQSLVNKKIASQVMNEASASSV